MSNSIKAEDLLGESAAERQFLLRPFLFHGSLSMIFAYPGIGKTWFTLWLASALACQGQFFRWQANKSARVLYIDSEMGKEQIRPRFRQIVRFSDFDLRAGQIEFVTPDLFKNYQVPNIAHPRDQPIYNSLLHGFDVLIIDNLGSASAPVNPRDTEEQTWINYIQPWFLKLRAQGKAVVLVHHAGKSGEQLGTSRREQPLDLIIRLSRPTGYEPTDGCQFNVSFAKSRHVFGTDLEPLFVKLIQSEESISWDWKLLSKRHQEEIERLIIADLSDREICEEIPRERSWVKAQISKIKRKIKEMETSNGEEENF